MILGRNALFDTFDKDRIDAFRGLACALLVANHVTQWFVHYHQLEAISALDINFALSYFRMPAFAFVSGLILGITSTNVGTLAFIFKKFKRLIIPFLFVTIVMSVGRGAVRGNVGVLDVLYLWIYPQAHMWFLPAAFSFFVTAAALSRFWNLRSTMGAATFLCVAFAVSVTPLPPGLPFAINSGANLFPFFALGLLFANRKKEVSAVRVYVIVAAVTCAVTIIEVTLGANDPFRNIIQSVVVLLGFAIMPRIKVLTILGHYSFTVYLFHISLISIGVRAMPGQPMVAGIGIFLTAIIIPILIEVGFCRITPFALPLIGQRRSGLPR